MFKDYSSPRPDTWVNLGGINKQGKKNPTTLEGYYLGRTEGPNQFDTTKTKVTFIFMNAAIDGKPVPGIVGVNGSSNLVSKMKDAELNFRSTEGRAPLGARTLVEYTGERNTGKGNPMKTYRTQFDADDTKDVAGIGATLESDISNDDYEGGDVEEDYTPPPAARSSAAEVQAALKNRLANKKN